MKSMEEMIAAAQQAAETISKQMNETQAKLDGMEVEGVSGGGRRRRMTAAGTSFCAIRRAAQGPDGGAASVIRAAVCAISARIRGFFMTRTAPSGTGRSLCGL